MDKLINYGGLSLIMLVCGLVGGATVYFTTSNEKSPRNNLLNKLLYGVIAAFLVPLFLNIISSDLMKKIGTDVQSFFMFIGFCLLAALSPKIFIETMTKNTLEMLKREQDKTKDKVESLEKNQNKKNIDVDNFKEAMVARNIGTSTEADKDILKGNLKISDNFNYETDEQIENKLLLEIGKNEKIFLYANTLIEKIGVGLDRVNGILSKMKEKKIINEVNVANIIAYGISINGVEKYKSLVNSIEWKVKKISEPLPSVTSNERNAFNVQVYNEPYDHVLEVYSMFESLSFKEGDEIKVNTVDGKKVHINYVEKV